MSLHIYIMYQENKEIITNPSFAIIGVLFMLAIKYLIPILIVLLIGFIVFRLLNLYGKLLDDSFSKLVRVILIKLRIKERRENTVGLFIESIIRKNKELFYSLFLLSAAVLWIYYYPNLIILGWVYYFIIFATLLTGIHRFTIYFRNKRSTRRKHL